MNVCSKCGKDRAAKASGSLTQWFSGCNCALAAPGDTGVLTKPSDAPEDTGLLTKSPDAVICDGCGKRVAMGRSGTFTQWIFRADTCTCAQSPGRTEADEESSAENFVIAFENAPAVDIDQADFPFERYKPVKRLGAGASGTVYLCLDRILKKKVAVKMMQQQFGKGEVIAFQREAKAMSRLVHRNIVSVLDFGVTPGGSPFMVMDYVEAATLKSLLEENRRLSWTDVCHLMVELCDALEYAHRRGIFHGDLKPANIMVSAWGGSNARVHLIDFGLAAFDRDTACLSPADRDKVRGTPAYMSPDTAQGLAYTASSDIYSVGCIMFTCLTGRPVFVCDTALGLVRMHANDAPPGLNEVVPDAVVPEGLDGMVQACLEKDPADRPSAGELRRALLAELKKSGLDDPSDGEPGSTDVPCESRKDTRFSLLALAVVAGFVLIGMLLSYTITSRPETSSSLYKQEPAFERVLSLPETPDEPGKKFKLKQTRNGLYCVASSETPIFDGDLKFLIGKPIISVNFAMQPGLTDKACDVLSRLPLKRIVITESPISNSGFAKLAGINGLMQLTLSNCNVTGKNVRFHNETLDSITLTNNPVEDGFVFALSPMATPRLSHLGLSGSKISDSGVKSLARLPLHKLELDRCRIDDGGFVSLAQNRKLEALYIQETGIGKAGIAALANLPLKKLMVDHSKQIDDDCLAILARNCPTLEGLGLSGTSVTSKGLKALKRLRKLTFLGIGDLPVDDRDVAMLTSFPRLDDIDLSNTGITDKALMMLAKAPRIARVNLQGCRGVSEAAIQNFPRKHVLKLKSRFIDTSDLIEGALK